MKKPVEYVEYVEYAEYVELEQSILEEKKELIFESFVHGESNPRDREKQLNDFSRLWAFVSGEISLANMEMNHASRKLDKMFPVDKTAVTRRHKKLLLKILKQMQSSNMNMMGVGNCWIKVPNRNAGGFQYTDSIILSYVNEHSYSTENVLCTFKSIFDSLGYSFDYKNKHFSWIVTIEKYAN